VNQQMHTSRNMYC